MVLALCALKASLINHLFSHVRTKATTSRQLSTATLLSGEINRD